MNMTAFTAVARDVSNANETYTLYVNDDNADEWAIVQTSHDTGVYTNKFYYGTGSSDLTTAWNDPTALTYQDYPREGITLLGVHDFFTGGS